MEILVEFFSNILSVLLPNLFKKHEPSELDKKYEQLRFDVAQALTMYACYYGNPIDLAKQADCKLPSAYEKASTELRRLGATASAIAAMSSPKKKKPITKSKMMDVSGALIGLSNSMTTPYNCDIPSVHFEIIHDCEDIIRKNLELEKNRI